MMMQKLTAIVALSSFLLSATLAFAQIPNPSFEFWTAGEPDGWRADNFAQLIAVAQSSTAYAGSSSARIQVLDEFGSMSCGGLYLDHTIALTVIPTALRGWYQFNRTGGETVQIEGFVTDPPINSGVMYSQDFFAPASSWTPFYIPFDYFYTPVAPDSAYFYFLMSCGQSATLNTYLLLDDLSFDVMVGSEESNPALLKTSTYPNPASDELHIGFEAPAPGTGRSS